MLNRLKDARAHVGEENREQARVRMAASRAAGGGVTLV